MALDPYQLCPCGSGKKIKFCCSKDIVAELDKVVRAIEGEQTVAAADHIDRLLDEHGRRPALLLLKATLLIDQERMQEAEAAAAEVNKLQPRNSAALSIEAAAAVVQGNVERGVDKLQDALEYAETTIPTQLYETIHIVAAGLLGKGNPLGARGHWALQAGIAGEQDSSAMENLVRLNLSKALPLILRSDFRPVDCPENVPWRGEFQAARKSAAKGAWRAACENFELLAEKAQGEPAILQNIAVLRTWLGEPEAAVGWWRQLSRVESLPLPDAVEAEAVAQAIELQYGLGNTAVEEVMLTFAVTDTEPLMEKLLSDDRIVSIRFDQRSDQGPPPKGVFRMLDRPDIEAGDNVKREDLPLVQAEVAVYGKETDQQARLQIAAYRDADFDKKVAVLKEIAGDLISESPIKIQKVGTSSVVANALSRNYHVSSNVSRETISQLVEDERSEVFLERWPQLELPELNGQKPVDVASDEKYRIPLLAAILVLEFGREAEKFDFNQLRGKLNLPENGPLDANDKEVHSLSLPRLARVEPDGLSDAALSVAFNRSVLSGLEEGIRRFGKALLKRESGEGVVDRRAVYEALVHAAETPDQAVQWTHEAQQFAKDAGQSPADWLLTELSLQLAAGNPEECKRLVRTIEMEHMQEPGVAESLLRLLAAFGLIRPDGSPMQPQPGPPPAEAAAAPAGIWTPGDSQTAAPDEPKSKLWVPGMD